LALKSRNSWDSFSRVVSSFLVLMDANGGFTAKELHELQQP